MRILFDNGTPRGLARFLPATRLNNAGAWLEELVNVALIEAAEQTGFDLMVTTSRTIEGRRLALVDEGLPGSYLEVHVPFQE